LNSKTQGTFDQIFQHPITHNLEWRDLKAMFSHLGEIEEEHNGNLKVTIGTHTIVFQSPDLSENASVETVTSIRHFLRTAHSDVSSIEAPHVLIVIDHREARIYHLELNDSAPETIRPYDPNGDKTHVHHRKHEDSGHNQQLTYDSYFRAIGTSLKDVEQIVIFGSGVGASSAMELLVNWLRKHEPKICDRIVAKISVDQSHMSEVQLLAKARTTYASLASAL